MKKRKTYEVSVINKTYSKTYSDQTKFYTSDTALELNFQLKEVEYDFDSAEIILLNVDDRSLVTRPVTKSAEGFTYELEDDIVAHYGEWKGQLKFDEGGEIYVSSPVSFRIENDLTNDRPPQLTEVNTWKNLRKIADGLIADIRRELGSVAEQLSEIEGAETTRQQAETQRVSAESSRVSAEAQRKTDHANRSAELARKADKVVLKNLVTNGDFNDGLTGWYLWGNATVDNPAYSLINNNLVIDRNNPGNGRIGQDINCNKHDKLYINIPMSGTGRIDIHEADYGSWNNLKIISSEITTSFSTIMGDREVDNVRLGVGYVTASVYDNRTIYSIQVINLTQTFGAGNEPTKEEMDELIKVTGYIDGEYALNNKEMLGHLMKGIGEKANKKQEDWITVPLFNGAQHGVSPLKVMKDEMGVVHFKGSLTNLVTGSKVFSLPIGYGPDIGATEGYIRIALPLNAGREISVMQLNYIGDCYMFNPSSTMVSFFDGVSYVAKRG